MKTQNVSSNEGLGENHRRGENRRKRHGKAFFKQFVKPRRRGGRRQTDTHGFHGDFHGPYVLLGALVVMCLCVVDVFATLTLLQKGSVELNPIMRVLIETDARLFFGFKYIATAVGIFLLLSYRRFRLYKTSFNSLHTLYGIIVVYSLLVTYQLTLLYLTAA